MSKSTLKILPALMVAITALMAQPVFGGAITHELIFTENSSTSLTVTFDGSTSGITVTPSVTDTWLVTLPSTVTGGNAFWTEPDNSNLFNFVSSNTTSQLLVRSDSEPNSGTGPLANGTSTSFGVYGADGAAIQAVFNDLGDVATIPDTGTTASLFGLSLTGLAFLRRKLC